MLEEYCERHHVFPKSVFGKNNRLVLLTAKEHYVAHKKRTYYAKGHKFTEEHKEKLKQAARNRAPMSKEHKLKLSLRAKEQWENRKNNQWL